MLGPTRRRWAVYTGVGSKWRWWALHVGVGSYTLVLGYTCGFWAVHAGIWLETEVLSPTHWRWVRDIGAGRTRWRSAQNVAVGSYTLVLGLTQWR